MKKQLNEEQIALHRELIAALRSGKYKQGQHQLKTFEKGPKYCCLGVFCELRVQKEHGFWGGSLKNTFFDRETCNAHYLPSSLRELLGVGSEGPVLTIEGKVATAAGFNDDGYSFNEIADAWEVWLEEKIRETETAAKMDQH